MEIRSGTTTERIIRSFLLLVLVGGFSGYSFWDGYHAYPLENVHTTFKKILGTEPPSPLPPIHEGLDAARMDAIEEFAEIDDVVADLGEGYAVEGGMLFFGASGHARLEVLGGRVRNAVWVDGPDHNASALMWQKIMAYGLAPLALILLVHFFRVLATKATLDEGGLQVGGKRKIPFEAMKCFQADEYKKKGWVDLEYEVDGQADAVRLDDYKIKEFRPIVAEICSRASIPNPLPPEEGDELPEPPATDHDEKA